MAQKIIRIGSSLGVTLPKRLLEKMHAQLGDEISVDFNSRRGVIEIAPMQSTTSIDTHSVQVVEQLLNEYGDELQDLRD